LVDGKPVLVPVVDNGSPSHDPLTERIVSEIVITETAYTVTYSVVALTAQEIEDRALAQESATDGRLINPTVTAASESGRDTAGRDRRFCFTLPRLAL
jgi:hypothetical protein